MFISAYGELDIAVQIMRRGAVDFISKPLDTQRLLHSLEEAVEKDLGRHQEQDERSKMQHKFDQLTAREKEIAVMIAKGLLNKQIAFELNITERTVQTHRTSAFVKLDIHSTLELYRILETIKCRLFAEILWPRSARPDARIRVRLKDDCRGRL